MLIPKTELHRFQAPPPPADGAGHNPEVIDACGLPRVLPAVRDEDLTPRLPGDQSGLAAKVPDTFSEIVSSTLPLRVELERASQTKQVRALSRRITVEVRGDILQLKEAINTDVRVPEMDGYERLRQIRSNPRLRCPPVIALTARAMKCDREKPLQAGASDCLAKPVNSGPLLALLRRCVQDAGCEEPAGRAAP